jgi:putative glutamine amidotransferase
MSEKPIIGITLESKYEPDKSRSLGEMKLNWNYAQMISDAGGVPVIIPPTADPLVIATMIDGWLIPGGLDIDAARFGEENHPEVDLQDGTRFEIEAALYRALPVEVPILGICYGCQFLNVIRGGSLEQHIPDRAGTEVHTGGTLATALVESQSRLKKIVGMRVDGKSYHHQAVGRVGEGLRVSARHEDGTIEGIESADDRWLLGVQWHPERTPDDPASRSLFQEFVNAAADYRTNRSRS